MYVSYGLVNSKHVKACIPDQLLSELSYKRRPISFRPRTRNG